MGYMANFQQGWVQGTDKELTASPGDAILRFHFNIGGQISNFKVARSKWCPHIRRVSLALDIGKILREVCRWE